MKRVMLCITFFILMFSMVIISYVKLFGQQRQQSKTVIIRPCQKGLIAGTTLQSDIIGSAILETHYGKCSYCGNDIFVLHSDVVMPVCPNIGNRIYHTACIEKMLNQLENEVKKREKKRWWKFW